MLINSSHIYAFFVSTKNNNLIKIFKMKRSILSMAAVAVLVLASCTEDDTVTPVDKDVAGKVLINGKLAYTKGTKLDVSGWKWKDAKLSGKDATTTLRKEYIVDATVSGVVSLTETIFVRSGATLTFEAGTEVVATKGGAEINIIVDRGGKINIKGTAAEPVIFSSEDGNSGDWGGLTILGQGITTGGENVKFEVGNYLYGGKVKNDNSGSIKYLVVRGTGAQADGESQTNGISFCAVGSGTVVDHISVIDGADDGIEFYGGSVKATNVYLKDNSDDSVDWTEGWDGGIENVYISHSNKGFSTAFEGDKVNNNPTFKNVTAVSTVGGIALQFKKASGATITNLYLEGYVREIDFKDAELFKIENVKIDGKSAEIKK